MGKSSWGKGLLCGLIGGLAGTIIMSEFQAAWRKAAEAGQSGNGSQGPSQPGSQEETEDATMKAAGKIARVARKELSHEQKKKLGPVVHYGFGALQGGLYGLILELARQDGGFLPALIFGAALFAAADEWAVPALGLSGKPTEYPLNTHVYALAAHLVYGLGTEISRRGLRAAV
jgi:putative membrane protein